MADTPEQLSIFESGAKRSSVATRFDLIPREALEALAARLTFGAKKYGEWNWQRGVGDPTFERDAVNHLLAHAYDYQLRGNSMEDNTGAIIANAAFLCYFEAKREQTAMCERMFALHHAAMSPQLTPEEIVAATKPAEPVSQRIELSPDVVVGDGVHLTDATNGHKMLLEELPDADAAADEAELAADVDAGHVAAVALATHLHRMGAGKVSGMHVVDGCEYDVVVTRRPDVLRVPRKRAAKKAAKKTAKRK